MHLLLSDNQGSLNRKDSANRTQKNLLVDFLIIIIISQFF